MTVAPELGNGSSLCLVDLLGDWVWLAGGRSACGLSLLPSSATLAGLSSGGAVLLSSATLAGRSSGAALACAAGLTDSGHDDTE